MGAIWLSGVLCSYLAAVWFTGSQNQCLYLKVPTLLLKPLLALNGVVWAQGGLYRSQVVCRAPRKALLIFGGCAGLSGELCGSKELCGLSGGLCSSQVVCIV